MTLLEREERRGEQRKGGYIVSVSTTYCQLGTACCTKNVAGQ